MCAGNSLCGIYFLADVPGGKIAAGRPFFIPDTPRPCRDLRLHLARTWPFPEHPGEATSSGQEDQTLDVMAPINLIKASTVSFLENVFVTHPKL